MHWHRWRLRVALFLALAVLVYWLAPLPGLRPVTVEAEIFDELFEDELAEGRYFRMVDESGRTIVITGRRLRKGDRYLDTDNRLYEVRDVENYLARARFVETVKHRLSPEEDAFPGAVYPAQARLANQIAIYHSHNAESYVPSDGTDSIYGRGGIHDVGVAFKDALENKGIAVLYSERLHLPHDRGAYRRSRVTAGELLARNPAAIFDVHRDAAPWDAYALEWDGEWITQIQFVVGLSHPGAAANRKFAFDLKGYADRIHPGLVRGVFLLFGSYNQDLSPLSLLLEVGSHTNTKEAAMRGITLFADVVAFYFYGLDDGTAARDRDPDGDRLPPALYRDAGGISGAISGTVVGLLLASLGAAVGFYFLNNPGSLENLYRWWERLPVVLAVAAGQARHFARNFPVLARHKWAESPGNLRRARHELARESRIFPGWIRSRGERAAARFSGALRGWWKELPGNWRHSWNIFLQESRKLPGLPARWQRRFLALVGRASGWVKRKAPPAWRIFRESLILAWTRLSEEAVRLAALGREKLLLIRKRLR